MFEFEISYDIFLIVFARKELTSIFSAPFLFPITFFSDNDLFIVYGIMIICSFGSESHCKGKDDNYLEEITFYLSSINLKKYVK